MKYYYKSPQEIREELRREKDPMKKSRHRGRIILLIDIAVLLLVSGVLYYKGFFNKKEASSLNTAVLENVEISASYTGSGSDAGGVGVILNVTNRTGEPIRFPGGKLKKIQAEFLAEGTVVHRAEHLPPERELRPGETALISLYFAFPRPRRARYPSVFLSLRLLFGERIYILRFPALDFRS